RRAGIAAGRADVSHCRQQRTRTGRAGSRRPHAETQSGRHGADRPRRRARPGRPRPAGGAGDRPRQPARPYQDIADQQSLAQGRHVRPCQHRRQAKLRRRDPSHRDRPSDGSGGEGKHGRNTQRPGRSDLRHQRGNSGRPRRRRNRRGRRRQLAARRRPDQDHVRRGPRSNAVTLMALNISAWSIRNPLPSIVFSIILLALGWLSFSKLAVTRLPSADIPVISVAVGQFGAAPAELESQVTKTIEDGVSGVEGVRHIASSITDGLSVTTIEFALETNTDRALNDVKDAVTSVRGNLPQNVTEPLIQRVDVIGLPIVTYAAISPGKTPEQLSYFVDDVVKRALQGVRGVAQVERIGGVEREIVVSLDPDRLQAAGLTAVNVSQSLRGTNVDLAGGRAEIGKNDQAIRTLAGAKTLNELAGTMIPLFSGGEVRLDDLGTVTDTIADRRTFARFNGEPVVALGIKRSKGAS